MLERELFRPLLSSCIYNTCLGFYWHRIENGAALNNNRKMFYHIYKLLGNWLINERLFSWWKCLTVRNIRCPSRWVKMNTPEESLQKTRDNVKYSQYIIIDTIDKQNTNEPAHRWKYIQEIFQIKLETKRDLSHLYTHQRTQTLSLYRRYLSKSFSRMRRFFSAILIHLY